MTQSSKFKTANAINDTGVKVWTDYTYYFFVLIWLRNSTVLCCDLYILLKRYILSQLWRQKDIQSPLTLIKTCLEYFKDSLKIV